jgi:uncharacterized membrane protein
MARIFASKRTFVVKPIIIIMLLATALLVQNSNAQTLKSKDYDLPGASINVNIDNNGLINVKEDIRYKFTGCYHEVYRTINIENPIEPKNIIYNEPVITRAAGYCNPQCTFYNRGYELAGNFGDICDTVANFYLDYDISKGIVLGNDVAEFHYKIWGSDWNKNLHEIKGSINLPEGASEKNTNAFFNPAFVAQYQFAGNTIQYSGKNLDGYLEVRLLMPKEIFNGNNYIKGTFTKRDALLIQSHYLNSYYGYLIACIIIIITLLFFILIEPIILFNKYGREPKIDYNGIFEREPVKGIKPYVINSLCNSKVGDTDRNGITTVLLDLIRRKHITLVEIRKKKLIFDTNDLELTFVRNQKDSMTEPEKTVYDYFQSQATDNVLLWSDFLDNLKKETNANKYIALQNDFEKSVDKSYDVKKYFDKTGDNYLKLLCGILLFSAIIIFIIGQSLDTQNYPFLKSVQILVPIVCFFVVIYSIIGFVIPDKVFGKFTPEGYEIYKRSMNYKKFMTDLTLLKKYPPASIVIWEEQLVYATAFGVADKVIKDMKVIVRESTMKGSSMSPFFYGNAFHSINSSYSTANSTIAAAAAKHSGGHSGGGFSGGGSVGGGFGGGGGGAR